MMFLSRTRPRPVSVSFFLNPHGPLSLTSHCPPRSAFPFSLPSQSLSCLWLSQFSFLFWSVFLSSVRSFLCFPFFFAFSLFPLCWRWVLFIEPRERGFLLLQMGSRAHGGWSASGHDWQGAAPSVLAGHAAGGRPVGAAPSILARHAARKRRNKRKEKKQNLFCLPLLHVQGKKKEEQCHSKRHRSDLFFFNMKRCRFRQNAPFHVNQTRRQNTSIFKAALNLSFVLLSP